MYADSPRYSEDELEKVQDDLRRQKYAQTSDLSIGLSVGFRERFRQQYYDSGILRHDPGDFPVDRERARDVIRYWWNNDRLELEPYDRITFTDRAGIPGKRDHFRVHLLPDPTAENLVSTLLWLVPPERRQADGTFGANLLRTFTNVVTSPHHDDEEFVILYILDRVGGGAETNLYNAEDIAGDGQKLAMPILTQQLNPGDILIFEDKEFMHDTTPLICPPSGGARRDALVCTVDYRTTYLEPPASS